MRDAALRHRGLGRRRQEHAHRAAAARHQADLRGPARGGRAHAAATAASTTPTSRCSPTACGPSASRASPSTSRTATSPRRSASSSSPTRPGHVQYTRNMVTGASTADLALVLVDARKGVLEQSRRHAVIASLLQVPHLVLCVNKMDLVDYDAGALRRDLRRVHASSPAKLDIDDLTFIPISALHGDNVIDALAEHAVVRGPDAAAPPRARLHRLRPQPHRRAVPGAVRDPADERTSTTTTAATPARSRAASSAPATRSWCCRRASPRTIAGDRRRTAARSTRRSRRCR